MFTNAKYIYTVCQERSFSKAAQKLYLSQSSLSTTIKRIEEKLGTPIFNRATNPISLTEFGVKYIEALQKVQTISKELDDYLYDINEVHKGHISLGAATCFYNSFFADLIAEFHENYPNITFDFFDSGSTYLIEKLDNGALDFLITHTKLDSQIYNQYLLACTELYAVISRRLLPEDFDTSCAYTWEELQPGLVEIKKAKVSISLFKELPYILLRPTNASRTLCDAIFEEAKVRPNVIMEVDQNSTSYSLALKGIGATIANTYIINGVKPQDDVLFFSLDAKENIQYIYMYTRKKAFINKAMQAFIKTMKNNFSL